MSANRLRELLAFPRLVERGAPAHLAVHLVADNYATHQHAKIKAWLAARPRYDLHAILTYSSWPDRIERWLGPSSERATKRGCFQNEGSLVRRIHAVKRKSKQLGRPFVRVAMATSILRKVHSPRTRSSDSIG